MVTIDDHGAAAARTAVRADRLFSEVQASLSNGSSIDSGWIDMRDVSKYQITYFGSAALSLVIESREQDSGSADLSTPATYSGTFYLADLPVRQRFMRFILTNSTGSAVTNAILAIGGIYGGVDGASVFPIEIPPSQFSPAMLVQAVLRGKDPFDAFQNVGVNGAGALLQSDFGTEVARGLYSGYGINIKFGRNPVINTTSTPEDVYNGGGEYTGFNATANENIAVASASANDVGTLVSSGTATGGSTTTLVDTGATFITDGVAARDTVMLDSVGYHGHVKSVDSETQITVYGWSNGSSDDYAVVSGVTYRVATPASTGASVLRLQRLLNADLEQQTPAYVILNGTSTVTATGDYMRCDTGYVVGAGSGGKNAGEITVNQATTTSNVFCVIPTFGRTTIGCSTIPTGKVGIIKVTDVRITRASGAAGSATVVLYQREQGSNAFYAREVWEASTGGTSPRRKEGGLILPPGTDFKFTVEEVSDNGTVCEVEAEYYEVDES